VNYKIDARQLRLGQRIIIPKDYLKQGKSDGHEMRKGTVIKLRYRWFGSTSEQVEALIRLDEKLFGERDLGLLTDTDSPTP